MAASYRESDTLIQAASSSIGDLMLVYKKLQRLAGFTTRVVELIEMIEDSKRKTKQVGLTITSFYGSCANNSKNAALKQELGLLMLRECACCNVTCEARHLRVEYVQMVKQRTPSASPRTKD